MGDAVELSLYSPEVLAQLPAGVPPNGVQPNLVNPATVGNYVLAANSILMAIMFTFAGLRFYTAIKIKRKMTADDWTTVASIVGSCYYFIVVCLAIRVDEFGTHMWDLSVAHMRTRNMAIIGFMSEPPHLIWPMIKTTFFLMYLQLFRPLVWLRRCVYAGLAIVWLWYLAMMTAQMVITSPPPGKGWVESFATQKYLKTFKLTVTVSSFGLVSDVYILILPLIAISHLKFSLAKKVGVCAMFSAGFICCLASSVSVYFQYRIWKNQNDFTYYVVFVYLSYTIEMCVGISTSCMPSLARFHKDNRSKMNSVPPSMGLPFRSLRKTTYVSNNSRLSNFGGYPKKSPYTYMEEGSELGSHEMGRVPSQSAIVEHPSCQLYSKEAAQKHGMSGLRHANIEPWGGN